MKCSCLLHVLRVGVTYTWLTILLLSIVSKVVHEEIPSAGSHSSAGH